MGTIHTPTGEAELVAGSGVDITGAIISSLAPPSIVPDIPLAVIAAIGNKSFRYIVGSSAAGGIQNMIGVVSNALAGANTPAPTNADLRTGTPRVNTTSNTANVLVGQNFTDPPCWRGDAANNGGFFIRHRFSIIALNADAVVAIGLNNAVIGGGADPSATLGRILLAADTADADLKWLSCSTPNGTFTKSAAVISKANAIIGDPRTNGPCVLEVSMWALPNDSKITCRLFNRSTGLLVNQSDISATLPVNTTNLRPTCVMSSKTNGAPATSCDYIDFLGYY